MPKRNSKKKTGGRYDLKKDRPQKETVLTMKLKPGDCLNTFRLKRWRHSVLQVGDRICRKCRDSGFCHVCGGKLHRGEKNAHGACQPHRVLEAMLEWLGSAIPRPARARAIKAIEAADRMNRINAENV